jgi:hypothetical protein
VGEEKKKAKREGSTFSVERVCRSRKKKGGEKTLPLFLSSALFLIYFSAISLRPQRQQPTRFQP